MVAGINNLQYDTFSEQLKQSRNHPFLKKHGVEPNISRFHFDVSMALLRAANVPPKDAEQILAAVLLLQQGLAIHDSIDMLDGQTKQLTVLAGDLSSGHYYQILAAIPNVQLLRVLCIAVADINEAKMALISGAELKSDGDTALNETIIGALLYALAEHYFADEPEWHEQIQALVRAELTRRSLLKRQPVHFNWRQVTERLTDAIDRLVKLEPHTVLQPIALFLLDYLLSAQKNLETQSLTEGNHTW